jgi:phage FluMu protein Com
MNFLKLFLFLNFFLLSNCSFKYVNLTLPYLKQINDFYVITEHVEHKEKNRQFILNQRNHISISLENNTFELNFSRFEMKNIKMFGDTLKFDFKLKKSNKLFQTFYINSTKEVQIFFLDFTLKYY